MDHCSVAQHGQVEAVAVEGDERAGRRKVRGNGLQQRPLVREPRHQILPRHEPARRVEPSAADEKRVRPRAAAQSCGFEIEEHERRLRVPARQQGCVSVRAGDHVGPFADGLLPIRRITVPPPFDYESRVAPLASERRFE